MTAHLSHRARLVSSREIAPNIRHFVFAIADVEKFGFVPGQFLSFVSEVEGKAITRAYSIASVPDENRVEICLNLVDDGHLSPRLFAMQPGEEMEVKGPYGLELRRFGECSGSAWPKIRSMNIRWFLECVMNMDCCIARSGRGWRRRIRTSGLCLR